MSKIPKKKLDYIINPKTQRHILIGRNTYNNLLSEGYKHQGDIMVKTTEKSTKDQYISIWKYHNAQKKIILALETYFPFFGLLSVDGKLTIYNSMFRFFDKKYKKNETLFDIDDYHLQDFTKYHQKTILSMNNFEGVVNNYIETYSKYNLQDETLDYLSPSNYYENAIGGFIIRKFILPLINELLQKIIGSLADFVDGSEEDSIYENSLDKYLEFSITIFEGYLEYKTGIKAIKG